jgi:hypothetical protein
MTSRAHTSEHDGVLSPFERAIEELRTGVSAAAPAAPPEPTTTAEDAPSPWGPRRFVEGVLEIADDVKENANQRLAKTLRAGDMSLAFLADHEDCWIRVATLYIRAFQSMYSRKALRKFVIALGDGRFGDMPGSLARIDPEWCTPAHALYAHFWTRISSDPESADKKARSEQALGRTIINQIVKMGGDLAKRKAFAPIVDRVMRHDPSVQLVGRLSRLVNDGDTSDLLHESIAHGQAMLSSGEIDMARMAREAMRLAQKNGVDPSELTNLTGMLNQLGGVGEGGKRGHAAAAAKMS